MFDNPASPAAASQTTAARDGSGDTGADEADAGDTGAGADIAGAAGKRRRREAA